MFVIAYKSIIILHYLDSTVRLSDFLTLSQWNWGNSGIRHIEH